jgi:hypothetical protein
MSETYFSHEKQVMENEIVCIWNQIKVENMYLYIPSHSSQQFLLYTRKYIHILKLIMRKPCV